MLIAGIIGGEGRFQTAGLIYTMLSAKGWKVSIADSTSLSGQDGQKVKGYTSELEKNKVDILLLKAGMGDLDKILSEEVRFDILIYMDKAEEEPQSDWSRHAGKLERILSMMAEKGIAIVNVDDSELIHLLQGMKHRFVTYGFNPKASITTSSIGDTMFKDSFICCLQRSVSATNGAVIEPQEYKLQLDSEELDSHNLLAAASFAIINGIDLNQMH